MTPVERVEELVARYPGVKIVREDGHVFTSNAHSSEKQLCLTNTTGQFRGAWIEEYYLNAGELDQLMLDLTEACDTLTRLMKETDE